MTDRYNAVVVAFDRDIREDDAEAVINAIRMIKGVVNVTPNVTDISDHVAAMRAKRELSEKLLAVYDSFK